MGKLVAFLYGIVAYLVFAIVIVYAIGFVCGLAVPKTIDSGPAGPLVEAIVINLAADVAVRRAAQRHGAAAVQAMVDAVVPKSDRAQHLRAARQPGARHCCSGSGGRSRR